MSASDQDLNEREYLLELESELDRTLVEIWDLRAKSSLSSDELARLQSLCTHHEQIVSRLGDPVL